MQKLADLENTLRLIGLDAAENAPLLAPLFDVALPEDRAAKFAPEELRRRQLAAMTAVLLVLRMQIGAASQRDHVNAPPPGPADAPAVPACVSTIVAIPPNHPAAA